MVGAVISVNSTNPEMADSAATVAMSDHPGFAWVAALAPISTAFLPDITFVDSAVSEGTTLYRVFGDEAQGLGQSWTTVNPGAVSDFRSAAGLFPGNSGQFVAEGTLTDSSGVLFRPALPGPGGIGGGLPEIVVPNPGSQICFVCVSGANPPF